ncbi:putative F-box associated interaction domain-containing protein [Arabidopsis thaliana]|uniref:F-box associated beta-propeller type 3 domain-containing protein n=2 Tax=Arabidopsis TaxID=3701 RepID=A0A178V893_ARATH|nr:F-box associated interaction domain [Arabidopsis thaliana x Arabidopsis arenosa]OAP02004.1 hypothetical protein AXX17_AT3G10890 [Arabidopsis thaliana]
MIECCKPHVPRGTEICINSVLYYTAVEKGSSMVTTVVCFDIRSEKFSFKKVMKTFDRDFPSSTTMINYNGKLGLLMTEESTDIVSGTSKSFELRVLEDAGKHDWSKHVYMLPPLWKNVVGEETKLRLLGMVGSCTNEIVFSYKYPSTFMPSYVFYYNIERNTIIRLEIQGMEELNGK